MKPNTPTPSTLNVGKTMLAVITLLGAQACSSTRDDSSEQEATFVGRYQITTMDKAVPYTSIWFSRDHNYEAIPDECSASDCVEKGSFVYRAGVLELESATGKRFALKVTPSKDGAAPVKTAALHALNAAGSDVYGGSTDDVSDRPCTGATVAALHPRTGAAGDPPEEGTLVGSGTCLLSGILTSATMEANGATFNADLIGTKPITTLLASASSDQRNAGTAQFYNCLSSVLWAVAGAADTVICGTAAVPSGGLTTACFVIGAGATFAGALAYCGNQCVGAHALCPGFERAEAAGLPPSFKETYRERLLHKCVGTQRYARWEGASRWFEDGQCVCRQACPTP